MKRQLLIFLACALLFSCQGKLPDMISDPSCAFLYTFHYNNESDYAITIYRHNVEGDRVPPPEGYETTFFPSSERPFMPKEHIMKRASINAPCPAWRDGARRLKLFHETTDRIVCMVYQSRLFQTERGGGGYRIYFNEGKDDERYITYPHEGIKPRDFRNPASWDYQLKEHENESYGKYSVHRYTFTNEDYEQALVHEATTPVPLNHETCNPINY